MTRTPLQGGHEKAVWRVVAQSYPCETCGAGPGEDCMSANGGRRSTEVHASRSSQASARGWTAADIPVICSECGNDQAVQGYPLCSDCLFPDNEDEWDADDES